MAETEIGLRIKEAAKNVGGLNKLAEAIGMPRRTLGDQLNRDDQKISFLADVAKETGVRWQWLATGEGAVTDNLVEAEDKAYLSRGDATVSVALPTATIDHANSGNLVTIPAYAEVRPSAGDGSTATSQSPTGIVAFDRGWLWEIGVNPGYAAVLFADGDSMYPTIPNGSAMIVDTSKLEIRHGCIYVFDLDGDMMVKRIERLPDGTIDLISDNRERYPTRNVTRDRLEKMHVIGRVYSAVRTF